MAPREWPWNSVFAPPYPTALACPLRIPEPPKVELGWTSPIRTHFVALRRLEPDLDKVFSRGGFVGVTDESLWPDNPAGRALARWHDLDERYLTLDCSIKNGAWWDEHGEWWD